MVYNKSDPVVEGEIRAGFSILQLPLVKVFSAWYYTKPGPGVLDRTGSVGPMYDLYCVTAVDGVHQVSRGGSRPPAKLRDPPPGLQGVNEPLLQSGCVWTSLTAQADV